MIVLHGLHTDTPLEEVRRALEARGASYLFVDQADCAGTVVRRADHGPELVVGGQVVPVAEVRGIYLRPYDLGDAVGAAEQARLSRLAFDLREWAETAPPRVRVVDRPSAGLSNHSKPRQSRTIAAAGFAVPETLLTTDPEAAEGFVREHGRAVVKSVGGTRSVVRTVGPGDDLGTVRWCPTQLQRFVPGTEYRVHAVGRRLFVHRIRSAAVDYRYGGFSLEPADLPDDVADRCRRLTDALGLELAGIDLRFGSDGRWYCWEVNTSPAYSTFDGEDGAIAGALAEHLADR